MRVIAGSAKGRRLFTPKGRGIRPTSDRVKEAIFNIIGPGVEGADVLDLFAGTGSLGIEALSRGASRAYFIDSGIEAVTLVKKNLEITGLQDKAVVIKSDVEKAVKRLARENTVFNLVFLDPPYRISVSYLDAILIMLALYLVSPKGLLIMEHSAKLEPRVVEGMEISSTRTYGDTAVTFYQRKGEN